MTIHLYQENSYLQSFDAIVIGLDHEVRGLILDQSAFYPGGGGQPSDIGFLTYGDKKHNLKRVKNMRGEIIHILEGDDPLPSIGFQVHGQIDWERRYKLMRTHTAMHILCGVIYRDYGASVTGGNMKPLRGRMDFEFETMRRELIDQIEDAINQEVDNARDVSWRTLPRDVAFQIPDLIRTKINLLPKAIKQVRVVEIEGLDLQADGGTHVKNTSEVGTIQVVDYKSKGKINKRIYVELQE